MMNKITISHSHEIKGLRHLFVQTLCNKVSVSILSPGAKTADQYPKAVSILVLDKVHELVVVDLDMLGIKDHIK